MTIATYPLLLIAAVCAQARPKAAVPFAATPASELPAEALQAPSKDPRTLAYYRSLPSADRRLFAKAASLGILAERRGQPYVFLYKKDGRFFLEACALVPSRFEDALPVARDFHGYGRWLFENINTRRGDGSGKYMLDLNSIEYLDASRSLRVRVMLNILWKGRTSARLAVEDHLSESAPPYLRLKLARPSRLASQASGDFKVYPLPDEPAFLLYFIGEARLNWAFYYLVPVRAIRAEVVERTVTLLENIRNRLARASRP